MSTNPGYRTQVLDDIGNVVDTGQQELTLSFLETIVHREINFALVKHGLDILRLIYPGMIQSRIEKYHTGQSSTATGRFFFHQAMLPGPRLNIQNVFPRYGYSYVKDKMVVIETVLFLKWG